MEFKEGAYQLITNLCNLFHARPVYHGDTRTVDILALDNRESMAEFIYEKNLKSVRVEHNTESLVTRLYVEGIFDDLGYIGIEDINPTGLGFLLNFDYFKSIGLFTDAHEAAVARYLEDMRDINGRIMAKSKEISAEKTALNILWGQCQYIVWQPRAQPNDREVSIETPATNAYEIDLDVGDEVAACLADGTIVRTKVTAYAENARITVADAISSARYIIRFKTPSAGSIAGKEVTIAAKESTLETIRKKLEQTTDERSRQTLIEQFNTTQGEIHTLLYGGNSAAGLYAQMFEAAGMAVGIAGLILEYNDVRSGQTGVEKAFADAMGDLLRDGYWNDPNYVKGQELALYSDGLDMIETVSKPIVSYRIGFLDLSGLEAYADERVSVNMPVHVLDSEIGLNDICFITKIVRHVDRAHENQVEISNQIINIAGQTFDSILARMAELSNQISGKKAVFERASVIGPDGKIPVEVLDGIIEVTKNKLASAMSNWYTDDAGNLVFEAHDGESAMMLTGAGFMIADGRDERGDWRWRSFGTGRGFTADEMIAGELRTGLVRILGTDRFYWDASNIYIIDPLNTDRQIRIGMYDGVNYGIGYTQDGGARWQNALGFDGLHFSFSNMPAVYKIDIIATRGAMLSHNVPSTQLLARVYCGMEDVTDDTPAYRFQWTRVSSDGVADTVWNLNHRGMKAVTITTEDVRIQAAFQCSLLGE